MVSIKNRKKIVALIPARSGSVRIKNKNILKIQNHPLLAYSIRSAINSKLFSRVIVSTDSKKYKKIAQHYGAEVPFLRPKNISLSNSSDCNSYLRRTVTGAKPKVVKSAIWSNNLPRLEVVLVIRANPPSIQSNHVPNKISLALKNKSNSKHI